MGQTTPVCLTEAALSHCHLKYRITSQSKFAGISPELSIKTYTQYNVKQSSYWFAEQKEHI